MLVWGSSFAVTKNAVSTIPPLTFALLRFVVASICLHIMLLTRKKELTPPDKIPFLPLFWMGLTGVGIYYIFFNYSLIYTSASMGALIQAFIPVIIALLAFFFLKEKISRLQVFSIIVSVVGVALVSLSAQADSSSRNPLLGNFLMMIAVTAWAVYTILSKKLANKDVLKVTCYSTYIGTILLIPSTIFELWNKPLPSISATGWYSILYLGAIASALSYLLYNRALKEMPAFIVGIFINLDPIIGAAIAMIFLKEQITAWQIVGSILVICGMYLSSKT
jgi:drug/metabolite transporter (DMT)-like permease